ncbi:MAG TPA: choice-of-anchor Q domain-containing protein, partial [Pyrinomonadaceae bacterium]|nr:choice-of-anchor Q domain-containing protein [Pyrinomonadaceae bacterium]
TNLNDAGPGSFRNALDTANTTVDDDVINIGVSGTIVVTGAQFDIENNGTLTINGNGPLFTVFQRSGIGRVFQVKPGATASMNGLTIANGKLVDTPSIDTGAGIWVEGTLTMNNTAVRNNESFFEGAGIYSSGTLTILNSYIGDNSVTGGYSAGGIFSTGITRLINTTMSGNFGGQAGGAAVVFGGSITLINSTIAGNSTTPSGTAGGVYIGVGSGGRLFAQNSIISDNQSFPGGGDMFGRLNSLGYNLIGNTQGITSIIGTTTGNILDQSALLASAAINGGQTKTMAPLPSSPVINAGNNALAVDQNNLALANDQRGAGFPRIGQGTVEMGAYEVNPREYQVDNLTDNPALSACTTAPNDCSLRGAISRTPLTVDSDTINFGVNGTIVITNGELSVSNIGGRVTINGNGALPFTSNRTEIRGTNSRIFNNAGDLQISNVRITNGFMDNSGGGPAGAAFRNVGALTIDKCMIDGNTINGALNNNFGGAIFNFTGLVNITDSTLANNSALGDIASGAAIYLQGGTVNITNSTLTGNIANGASGSFGGAISVNNGGTVNLTNTTVANNSALSAGSQGGGIYNGGGTINLGNTILSENTAPSNPNGSGGFVSNGFNLFGNTAGITITGTTTGNMIDQNANLAPLGFYGGPTYTQTLGSNSPAINNGSAGGATLDQRGAARVGTADIGAVEYNNSANGGSFKAVFPNAPQYIPYSVQFIPNNGTNAFNITGGTYPPGLSLGANFTNRTAETKSLAPSLVISINGQPTAAGVFNFSITVFPFAGGFTSTTDYQLQVVPTTAANAEVGGKVLTADGRGISRALVTMTDANGNTKSMRTNSFGYFKFEDVHTGETYVFHVLTKGYNFTPQIVTVNENISELNFTMP